MGGSGAPVGTVWAEDSWSDTCWAANTWADRVVPPPSTRDAGGIKLPRRRTYRLPPLRAVRTPYDRRDEEEPEEQHVRLRPVVARVVSHVASLAASGEATLAFLKPIRHALATLEATVPTLRASGAAHLAFSRVATGATPSVPTLSAKGASNLPEEEEMAMAMHAIRVLKRREAIEKLFDELPWVGVDDD